MRILIQNIIFSSPRNETENRAQPLESNKAMVSWFMKLEITMATYLIDFSLQEEDIDSKIIKSISQFDWIFEY